MSQFDLPEDRLASTDEKGKRIYIEPSDVRGRYRNFRNVVYFVLMIIFLALPWIKIRGHQALLLDFTERKFAIFGMTFWGHDAPMLFFVLAAFFLSIGLTTSIFGRLWCGWVCPETVFVDLVYRRIERWIEGDAPKRKKLNLSPMTLNKFTIKGFKWLCFLLVSLFFTHSFMAYFIGTDDLMIMMQKNPVENFAAFKVMLFITGIIMFAFGWFREQFCIIMCPYGRFQSTLMDDHSLTVAYDQARGEPRKAKDLPKNEQGDCINCYRCVQVCPTGVDIRRGSQQLECVACTACIDACDEVMTKIKKPIGLIRYETDRGVKGQKVHHFRARTIVYGLALFFVVSGLFYVLLHRKSVTSEFFHARNTPYQVLKQDGQDIVVNQFNVNISNYTFEDGTYVLSGLENQIEVVSPQFPYELKAGSNEHVSFFVKFPRSLIQNGRGNIKLKVFTKFVGDEEDHFEIKDVRVVGPF